MIRYREGRKDAGINLWIYYCTTHHAHFHFWRGKQKWAVLWVLRHKHAQHPPKCKSKCSHPNYTLQNRYMPYSFGQDGSGEGERRKSYVKTQCNPFSQNESETRDVCSRVFKRETKSLPIVPPLSLYYSWRHSRSLSFPSFSPLCYWHWDYWERTTCL